MDLTDCSIFSYVKRDSLIHRISGGIKLIVLVLISGFVYSFSLYLNLSVLVFAILICFVTKISPKLYLRDLVPVFIVCVFIFISNICSYFLFKTQSVLVQSQNVFLMIKLINSVLLTSVFFKTTSSFELKKVFSSVYFIMFVSFIPKIFEIIKNTNMAYEARGVQRGGIQKIIVIIPSVIAQSINKANDLYISLSNREQGVH